MTREHDERDAVLSRHAVSRETAERLDAYAALLRQWQARINLVAPSTLPHLWTRHLEEGLVLGALVPRETNHIVDLGSGGGLPGIVLTILLQERGGGTVTLVESNGKKAAFLRTVVRELDLPAEVSAQRIERAGDLLEKADLVTARALASLDVLFGFVAPHLHENAFCLFPKGRAHDVEIAAASALYRFDMVKHEAKGDEAGSVILEIRNLVAR